MLALQKGLFAVCKELLTLVEPVCPQPLEIELALPLVEFLLVLLDSLVELALPLAELALPLAELALPLAELALPLAELMLALAELALPLAELMLVLGDSILCGEAKAVHAPPLAQVVELVQLLVPLFEVRFTDCIIKCSQMDNCVIEACDCFLSD